MIIWALAGCVAALVVLVGLASAGLCQAKRDEAEDNGDT